MSFSTDGWSYLEASEKKLWKRKARRWLKTNLYQQFNGFSGQQLDPKVIDSLAKAFYTLWKTTAEKADRGIFR